MSTAKKMKGVAIDRFGGLETLSVKSLPVPQIEDDEILIHVESAGVGAGILLNAREDSRSSWELNRSSRMCLARMAREQSPPSVGKLLSSAKATAFMRAASPIPRADSTQSTPPRRLTTPRTCRTRSRPSKPGCSWSMR